MYRINRTINVRNYGALGTGDVDDQPAIQAAIDDAISSNGVCKTVYFPPGNYRIDSPIMVYDWNGTDYQFVTISLIGTENAAWGLSKFYPKITANFTDSFAIGIQAGKGCVIRGLSIIGQFSLSFASMKAFIDAAKNYDTFGASLGCRDSRYSPYSGIVFDPFSPTAPPDDGYPEMSDWYRGTGPAAGSGNLIENCGVRNFVACIIYSPNGTTQNAESSNIDNCVLETCKVAVSLGQDQTKQNNITRCTSWNYTHTFIDNLRYGTGEGCPSTIDGLDLAGSIYQLCNINTGGRVGTSIRNVFAESTFQFGRLTGASSKIESSQMEFLTAVYPTIGSPDYYMNLNNVHVSGCTFRHYDNQFNKRLFIKAAKCTFQNVQWDLPPIVSDCPDISTGKFPYFINCTFGNGYAGNIGQGNHFPMSDTAQLSKIALYGNFKVNVVTTPYGNYEIEYNEVTYQKSRGIGSATASVNLAARTGSLIISNQTSFDYLNVGDYLYYLSASVPSNLGRITALNTGSNKVTLSEMSVSMPSSSILSNIFHTYVRYVGKPFIGDLANGSKTITNVIAPFGFPAVGDRLEGRLVGRIDASGNSAEGIGAYITAVNTGNKTVTMNLTANVGSSGSRCTICCGNPHFRIRKYLDINNFPTEALFKGTEIIFDTILGNNFVRKKYVVERGGYISGSQKADWYEYVDCRIYSGTAQYFDSSTQRWESIVHKIDPPVYDTDQDAGNGGLVATEVYRTSDGFVKVKL